jgi:hypothetical protein
MKLLNEVGLRYYTEKLRAYIEQETEINIATQLDEDSTDDEVAGAKAVYDHVNAMIANTQHIEVSVVASLPATGAPHTIYLVKVDADTYKQHIYVVNQWYDLGTTDVDLLDYWSKDDLGVMDEADVQEIIDDVLGA